MADDAPHPGRATSPRPILIKRYAHRRLYDTDRACYVTLDDLSQMVNDDVDFVVQEAETGANIDVAALTLGASNLLH